jgi:methylenetetrahydrofolate dehydrogenase (NADP+)/methenyltetrahydrofolate cyclohydrolase
MKIDGRQTSIEIKEELKLEIDQWVEQGGKRPHLAAVLVGEDAASMSYVRGKIKSCEKVGIVSTLIKKPASISQEELLDIIDDLNSNNEVDGYIVQLPLPGQIDEHTVTLRINPEKDVDGFHPQNLGRMMLGLDTFLPATPFGIVTLLDRYNIPTEGKHCVVLGRSNIVGTPLSVLLSRKRNPGNCTVTIVHSRTKNIKEILLQADILVAAIGRAAFVQSDMVKPGAVVIDVGINRVDDINAKRGYRLVGDVDYTGVSEIASFITPVPGGVGPMTIVSLLKNTLKAAQRKS